MKRFASLLAVMALFAFAGAAFATGETCTALDSYKGTDPRNNGGVTDGETTVYYYGGADEITPQVGVNATVTTTGTSTFNQVLGAKSDDTAAKYWRSAALGSAAITATSTPAILAAADPLKPVPAVIKLTRVGVYANGSATDPEDAASAKSQDLTVNFVPVDLSADFTIYAEKGEVLTINVSTDLLPEGLAMCGVEATVVSEDSTADYDFSTAAKVVKGLNVAYDKAKFTLTISNDQATPAPDGTKLVLAVKATNDNALVVTDGVADKITVAGVANEDYLGYLTINVINTPGQEIVAEIAKSDDLKKAAKPGTNIIVWNNDGEIDAVNATLPDVKSTDRTITFGVISLDVKETAGVKNIAGYEKITLDGSAISGDVKQGEHSDTADGKHVAYIKAATRPDGIVIYELDPQDLENGIVSLRGAAVADEHQLHVDFPKVIGLPTQSFKYVTTKDVPDSKGSSGACSMGAGILALAGLAVVLRKRG